MEIRAMAIDSSGRLYAYDEKSHTIQIYR